MINRRSFMRNTALGAMALGTAGLARGAGASQRPSILFILTDDQRWDAMGCVGHPFLKTPHMDRIRNEGVLFENAFVTTSLCSPSRASFLTGTYAHTHGVLGNENMDYDATKTPSFTQVLREKAGYRTAFIGKWHMDSSTDNPRPGFDYWLSFKGQGLYHDPPLNENGRAFQPKGYMTDILTEHAADWLEANARGGPFCLIVSHKAVHAPFTPAERHANQYAEAEIPEPPAANDSLRGKPAWQRARAAGKRRRSRDLRSEAGKVPDFLPTGSWSPPPEEMPYLRSISAIDDSIGRLLGTLETTGQLDNTIIVFAGDNGYFWSEHRRGDKRLAYEESIRIPLLMRYPAKATHGGTVSEMVLNIDLAPTLLDLAGVGVPRGMEGRSVRPLLEGGVAKWRQSFLYEYWVDFTPSIPRMIGVRTDRWKYVTYPDIDDLDELYDLLSDPHEMMNLAALPEHTERRQALRAEMERLMRETNYRMALPPKAPEKGMGCVLDLDFSKMADGQVPDASTFGNHGQVAGAVLDTESTPRALRFTGQEHIAIAHSESLDPSNAPWVVEAWVRAEGDGVIVAHGGASLGYLLFVENEIPAFAVRDGVGVAIADGAKSCLGRWVHLVGAIQDRQATLYVNGNRASSISLMQGVPRNPNEGIQIGRDTGTAVDEKASGKGFHGLIRSVRVFCQAFTPDEIGAMARQGRL